MPENSLPQESVSPGRIGVGPGVRRMHPCVECGSGSRVASVDRPTHTEVFASLYPSALEPSASLDAQVADLSEQWLQIVEKLGPRARTVAAFWHVAEPLEEESLSASVLVGAPSDAASSAAASVNWIIQPPCCSRCLAILEIQIQVEKTDLASGRASVPTNGNGAEQPASVHVHDDAGGCRHVRISGIVAAECGKSFEDECEQVLSRSESLLQKHGAKLEHVARTWIYLRHMERDYDDLNRVRRVLFDRRELKLYPASTGVGGATMAADRDLSLSLYAIVPSPEGASDVHASPMSSHTFNGPWEYGSYFARGMRLETRGGSTLLISGTASINAEGETVAVGDLEQQIDRTLENILGLLEGSGAGLENVVQVTSYLKNGADRDRFRQRLESTGLFEVPHAIVEAEICRPELLVEIELIACL